MEIRLNASRNNFILTCVVHVWQVGFVAADMTHPARDLPRVLNTAMGVAVSGFVLMNIALFMVLPFEQMRQKSFVAVVCSLSRSCYTLNQETSTKASTRISAFKSLDFRVV